MRNKAKDFPVKSMKGEAGEARAKSNNASKRPNGTINTDPQDRMMAANQTTGEET
ncbi:small, acid-soluble spore protein K [Bacillaceae bacterium SAS-127]|nr:small, acid-soluble spore protein K [Bacillaceae bacterium SAS-127]